MYRVKTEAAFKKIKTAREELYALFLPLTAGGKPGKEVLLHFNRYLSEALGQLRLEHMGGGMRQKWDEKSDPLMLPLWMVVHSAYEVLLNDPAYRIKACPACGWLFLDTTKNNGRRWCSSQACGSIDKASRYYDRKKQQEFDAAQ